MCHHSGSRYDRPDLTDPTIVCVSFHTSACISWGTTTTHSFRYFPTIPFPRTLINSNSAEVPGPPWRLTPVYACVIVACVRVNSCISDCLRPPSTEEICWPTLLPATVLWRCFQCEWVRKDSGNAHQRSTPRFNVALHSTACNYRTRRTQAHRCASDVNVFALLPKPSTATLPGRSRYLTYA